MALLLECVNRAQYWYNTKLTYTHAVGFSTLTLVYQTTAELEPLHGDPSYPHRGLLQIYH